MTFSKDTYKPSRIVGDKIAQNASSDDTPIMPSEIDISEDVLYLPDADLLSTILMDRSTGRNIIWATDTYEQYGDGYTFSDEITPERITGDMNLIIQPRIAKDKDTAGARTKNKAEVFTPSWICRKMNDCVDDAWFGIGTDGDTDDTNNDDKREHAFDENGAAPKNMPKGKTWQDYIAEDRLEITCGEAPYIASRYDATTGEPIPVKERYGILDRKLRIVSENVDDTGEWLDWAKIAYKHIYGYEWQGDSLLLARENVLATVIDHYRDKFGGDAEIPTSDMMEFAEIVSWNIWQMDGLKFVVPGSCHDIVEDAVGQDEPTEAEPQEQSLFQDALFTFDDEPDESGGDDSDTGGKGDDEDDSKPEKCPGCEKNKRLMHNGVYSLVMDWEENKLVRFVDLF